MSDLKEQNNIIYLGPPNNSELEIPEIKSEISETEDKNISETPVVVKKRSKKSDKANGKKNNLADIVIQNPIWLSVSEAAKISGVNQKTIRRAIQAKQINYKIHKDRYLLNLTAIIEYMHTNTKLKNKFKQYGLGQYLG